MRHASFLKKHPLLRVFLVAHVYALIPDWPPRVVSLGWGLSKICLRHNQILDYHDFVTGIIALTGRIISGMSCYWYPQTNTICLLVEKVISCEWRYIKWKVKPTQIQFSHFPMITEKVVVTFMWSDIFDFFFVFIFNFYIQKVFLHRCIYTRQVYFRQWSNLRVDYNEICPNLTIVILTTFTE